MATATKKTFPPVTFDDPDSVTRTKRPWYELYPDAAEYVDTVLQSFVKAFGNEDAGFCKKATGFEIPLERDSEHPNMRAVRLANDRCRILKLNAYAAIKNGKVHFIIGERVVKPRAPRKPKTDAAE